MVGFTLRIVKISCITKRCGGNSQWHSFWNYFVYPAPKLVPCYNQNNKAPEYNALDKYRFDWFDFDFQLLHSAKCRSSMQEHTNKLAYIQLQHNIHTHTLYKQEKLIQKFTHVKHTNHNCAKYNHINGRRKQLWSFPQVNHSTTVQQCA